MGICLLMKNYRFFQIELHRNQIRKINDWFHFLSSCSSSLSFENVNDRFGNDSFLFVLKKVIHRSWWRERERELKMQRKKRKRTSSLVPVINRSACRGKRRRAPTRWCFFDFQMFFNVFLPEGKNIRSSNENNLRWNFNCSRIPISLLKRRRKSSRTETRRFHRVSVHNDFEQIFVWIRIQHQG